MIKESLPLEELRLELVHLKTKMNSSVLKHFCVVHDAIYFHLRHSFSKWPTNYFYEIV